MLWCCCWMRLLLRFLDAVAVDLPQNDVTFLRMIWLFSICLKPAALELFKIILEYKILFYGFDMCYILLYAFICYICNKHAKAQRSKERKICSISRNHVETHDDMHLQHTTMTCLIRSASVSIWPSRSSCLCLRPLSHWVLGNQLYRLQRCGKCKIIQNATLSRTWRK